MGGLLARHTESEYTEINRQNKEEVKLPPLEQSGNTFLLGALSGSSEPPERGAELPLRRRSLAPETIKYFFIIRLRTFCKASWERTSVSHHPIAK